MNLLANFILFLEYPYKKQRTPFVAEVSAVAMISLFELSDIFRVFSVLVRSDSSFLAEPNNKNNWSDNRNEA